MEEKVKVSSDETQTPNWEQLKTLKTKTTVNIKTYRISKGDFKDFWCICLTG